jgi:hypothetical protein
VNSFRKKYSLCDRSQVEVRLRQKSRHWGQILSFSATLVGLLLMGQSGFAQTPASTLAPLVETQGDATRTVIGDVPNAVSSFQMSNPYCFQPDASVNQCNINIRYLQANDNGSGVSSLGYVHVTIDGKLRYRATTFFETSVAYSYDMIPGGIKVACGLPNEGGYGALYGKGYAVAANPYTYADVQQGGNYSTVKCPAFNP